jgi:hypothetical protein
VARRGGAARGGWRRKNYGGGTPGTWAAFSGWADRWVLEEERRGGVGRIDLIRLGLNSVVFRWYKSWCKVSIALFFLLFGKIYSIMD